MRRVVIIGNGGGASPPSPAVSPCEWPVRAWASGTLDSPPVGIAQMPRIEALFRTTWEVDQTWMPQIRSLVALEEQRGKRVFRLASVSDLDNFGLPEPGNSN
jgi:hypothetical protein